MGRRRDPRVIDLFAGAGVFSGAFVAERFEVIGGVEADAWAARTYRTNVGADVEVKDIRRMRPSGSCDVLVAGPPCQGFSTIGRRDAADPRNLLSLEVVRWARRLKPDVVVVENVPAFLTSEVFATLRRRFRRAGFVVESVVLDAFDFGAPQWRRRAFVFASRRPLDLHSIRSVIPPARTVRKAWRGLPRRVTGTKLHYSPRPSEIALRRMRVIPPGGDRRDVMKYAPELAAPSWWRLACQVTDVWGRMVWSEPSNTLKTEFNNASKGRYIHPSEDRVISLREAARLQTIPDTWEFSGFPVHVARQIGNSVPPALGRAIANMLRRHLR